FAREGTGLLQIDGVAGEVLVGTFKPVPRRIFFDGYQKAFGGGTIDADGPDLAVFGNAFVGMLGTSNPLVDTAYGENYDKASGKTTLVVKGPILYCTATIVGVQRTTLQCVLIGFS